MTDLDRIIEEVTAELATPEGQARYEDALAQFMVTGKYEVKAGDVVIATLQYPDR